MAAVLGLIIGVVVGVFVRPDIPVAIQPYLPIMVVAALDALLGAARAYFERRFSDRVFIISFFAFIFFFLFKREEPSLVILYLFKYGIIQ